MQEEYTEISRKNKNRSEQHHIRSVNIPTSIFKNRGLSVLESLVVFLKEEYELHFHDISKLLNRDDRTIWTVYDRAKKKRTKNAI
jgi:hypothetical protein